MTRHQATHPDQLLLDWESDPAIQARIELLVSERAASQAFLWRFRLMIIESVTMGVLVAVAGLTLNQPTGLVIRSALIVAGACFGSGMLLIGLSAGTAVAIAKLRARWAR
jgi:hypothetical protein